jgi:ribonuclease P protein component
MMPRPQRFPRPRRILKSSDFERVRKEGGFVRGTFLSLGFLEAGDKGLRAGFVTSRRVGNAVVRNRVRRRLREIFRRHQDQLVPSFYLVTVAHPAGAKATFAELEHEWLRLAKRTSILAP